MLCIDSSNIHQVASSNIPRLTQSKPSFTSTHNKNRAKTDLSGPNMNINLIKATEGILALIQQNPPQHQRSSTIYSTED